VSRDFVWREHGLAVGDEVIGASRRSGSQVDDGTDVFTKGFVRHGEHRRLENVWVSVQRGFDVDGCDVLPTADHEVLGAVDDVQVPVLVQSAEVAGAQPATGKRGLRLVVATPVPRGDRRAAQPDLADLTGGDLGAGLVDDPDVADRDWNADAGRGRAAYSAPPVAENSADDSVIPGLLSGGEQQMLSLALALVQPGCDRR